MNGQDDNLDIFGQQPRLRIYTQICLCYPVADASSHSAIVISLTNGLERLSESFPWVAGQVVNEGACEGNTGIFKIRPLDKTPRLVVKDIRGDPSAPTMEALRRTNFPISMLDESIVAPRTTLPSSEESPSESAPIFLVQATFISGGLLLTFLGHHSVMDMTGQGQVMDLLSKACRNEKFTDEEISTGNLDRRNVISLLDDSYKPGPELNHQMVKPLPSNAALPIPSKSTWANFCFSPRALADLKSLATDSVTTASGYVSTDDAVSAFIWQSVTRARLPHLDPTTEVTFARAVDPRRYLGVPQTYTGLIQNMTYHTCPVQKLIKEALGSVASDLRSAVDPKTSNLAFRTRALATVLSRAADKSLINVTANLNPSKDIMLSSWAGLDSYGLDFGLGLGKPESVRRPRFFPVESLMYLMPRRPDGEITAAICLGDDDMERLKADIEYTKYGEYIG